MRDVTIDPILLTDVDEALTRAVATSAHSHVLMLADDALSLGYLRSFIAKDNIQKMLNAHLEAEQPHPIKPGIPSLSNDELQRLVRRAIWNPYLRRKPTEITIWSMEYKGVSTRGSHVFDANGRVASEARIYVREDEQGYRAELSEDAFLQPRAPKEPPPKHEPEESVSATMDWVERLSKIVRDWWRNL